MIYLSKLESGNSLNYDIPPARHAWLQVLRGAVTLNETAMDTSDGAAISNETELSITATNDSEVMLFNLG